MYVMATCLMQVKEMSEFRRSLPEEGSKLYVVKNKLLKLASGKSPAKHSHNVDLDKTVHTLVYGVHYWLTSAGLYRNSLVFGSCSNHLLRSEDFEHLLPKLEALLTHDC